MQRAMFRLFLCTVALCFLGLALDNAQARPKYMGEFLKKYPQVVDQAKQKKCNVCHEGKDKKNRNEYGTAIARVIGKSEKDPERLQKYLEEVGKLKPKGSDKTYAEKIEAGILPND